MLQIVRLGREHAPALEVFFRRLDQSSTKTTFSPHPFTSAEVTRLTTSSGRDIYFLALEGAEIVAYGMLRGWDEGYDVPSLGVCVHPDHLGAGLGERMTRHLIEAARNAGSKRVILKVNRDNAPAKRLYEKLGFSLVDHDATYLKGTLALK